MNLKYKTFPLVVLCLLLSNYYCMGQQKMVLPDSLNYIIEDSVMINTGYGITLSAVVVRKKGITEKLSAALQFTIYSSNTFSLTEAKYAADQGYVGIVADARGKRYSPDLPRPYETEYQDVNAVIDWIIQQPWSDGQVGMYGGSYLGFAQWAALKNPNPALKTIVPYVAAIPGQGLPMENNIFLLANYQWAFYVTNNKFLDQEINRDNTRWNRLRDTWWESGAPFAKIDSLDGTPNPWLHKWLAHPDYDAYWQSMVPYKSEYSQITIPVLTITGYYDDGQISALHYLREHYHYNPAAEHYLIIGPYDHFGAQLGGTPELRGYHVDPVALINTRKITFEWLDHILKGAQKPALLRDRINFEIMGANSWRHVSSLEAMEPHTARFYLEGTSQRTHGNLSTTLPTGLKPWSRKWIWQTGIRTISTTILFRSSRMNWILPMGSFL